MKLEGILIRKKDNLMEISNNTDFTMIISTKPVKPKRKSTDFLVIESNKFILLEDADKLDLTTIIITLRR